MLQAVFVFPPDESLAQGRNWSRMLTCSCDVVIVDVLVSRRCCLFMSKNYYLFSHRSFFEYFDGGRLQQKFFFSAKKKAKPETRFALT